MARAFVLPASNAPEVSETWGMDKGLPQTSVAAVIQTRDGYIWAGTDGGLARFDGLKFTTFRTTNTPGLTNHAVTKLLQDRHGELWVGTESGLIRYRAPEFHPAGLEGETITALAEDAEGVIWVGTDRGAHRLVGGELTRFGEAAGLPAGGVDMLFADAAGRLWIGLGAERGLFFWHQNRLERDPALPSDVLAMAE